MQLLNLQFLLRRSDVARVTLLQIAKLFHALVIKTDPALGSVDAVLQLLQLLPCLADLLLDLIDLMSLIEQRSLPAFDGLLLRSVTLSQMTYRGEDFLELMIQSIVVAPSKRGLQDAQIVQECLVASGFPSLPLQTANLPLHLFDDVRDAHKIRFGIFQFAKCFFFLRLIARDACGLFKNGPPIFWT